MSINNHTHCWHLFFGSIHMVIPNGHVIQECCSCETIRTIHRDHVTVKGWEGGGIKERNKRY